MKTIKVFTVFALAALLISSCVDKGKTFPGVSQKQLDSASYAIGVSIGSMVGGIDLGDLNYQQFVNGFKDINKGNDLKINDMDINRLISEYLEKRAAFASEESLKNVEEGKVFLEKNKTKPGVVTTESGLQYQILAEGSGANPTAEDVVEVHYVGTLINGEEFDSSYSRGETATFGLNQVIPGWTEGIQYVKEGGKIKLWIPSELGYGDRSAGKIPPHSTLVFEVELVKINPVQE